MDSAKGCSLTFSTLADNVNNSFSVTESPVNIRTTFGFPSVNVPVLSTTRVSTFSMDSSTSAFLINTPAEAPFPVPTIMDMGVANPKAQGQAMINTATILTSA